MGVDINEGAAQISRLLQQEQPSNSEEPETVEQPETAEVEPEMAEAEPDAETEEQVEEETLEGDTDLEPRYKVKVDGEELEVGIDDLRKGYMMERDYRKKTSEVARARDEVRKQQEALLAKINDAEIMLDLELEDLNSDASRELKEYDPSAFYEKKEALEAKKNKLQELKRERLQIEQQRKAESIGKEKELLLQALPEWLDEKTLNEEAPLLNKQWQDLGFNDSELDVFSDHRLILLTRKAALYDKLKSAKPENKKVQVKPKAAKPGSATTNQDRNRSKVDERRSKLKQTGNVRDAQAAIKSLLRK